jgi:hypothetical protein
MPLWYAEILRTRVVYVRYGTPGVAEWRMRRENRHKAGYLARFVT